MSDPTTAPDAPPGKLIPFPRTSTTADAINSLRDVTCECAATLVDQHANVLAFGVQSAFTREEVIVLLRETARTIRRLKTAQPEPSVGGAA